MTLYAAPLPSIGLLLEPPEAALPGAFGIWDTIRGEGWPIGAYRLEGTLLFYGHKLVGAAGTYTLSGQDATLSPPDNPSWVAAPLPMYGFLDLFTSGALNMPSEPGVFALTGIAASMWTGASLAAGTGSFAWTGAPAERDMEINGDRHQFSILGFADLLTTRKASAGAGSFAMTGVYADMRYEPVGSKTIQADFGSFLLAGQDAGNGIVMLCSPGAFVMTGATLAAIFRWSQVASVDSTWSTVAPVDSSWVNV